MGMSYNKSTRQLANSSFDQFPKMNGNQIPNLHALEGQLGSISTLQTLYLESNPCQAADMTGYRRKIILALPQLKQIDATCVFLLRRIVVTISGSPTARCYLYCRFAKAM